MERTDLVVSFYKRKIKSLKIEPVGYDRIVILDLELKISPLKLGIGAKELNMSIIEIENAIYIWQTV